MIDKQLKWVFPVYEMQCMLFLGILLYVFSIQIKIGDGSNFSVIYFTNILK